MTELTRRATAPITEKVSKNFAPEMVRVVRDTVARDCTEPEFHLFLEVAARYELNPLVGEIWAAKMPGKNGSAGRVAFIVGRDGLLKVAQRYEDFRGLDADVVREKDQFKVVRDRNGRSIEHTYEGGDEARGPIIGAWAEVQREGMQPTYFYAPLDEYLPTSEAKLKFSPWGSQVSSMIVKCAQSTALRYAYALSGLYSEGELTRAQAVDVTPGEPQVEWGSNEVADRLRVLVEAANELKPGAYRPAKLQVLLNDKSDEERLTVARQIEQFIVGNGGVVPDPPVDAEVVEGEA